MKQELQRSKSGSCKQKTKGTVVAEASQNKMEKQTKIDKGENIKSLSSPTPEAKRRKETKLEPEKNSGIISLVQLLSKSKSAESRKPKPNIKPKKPKATSVSVKTSKKKPSNGTAAQNSVKKGKTTSTSEQGKEEEETESGSHEKLKPKSPNSNAEAREKNHDSLSMRAEPSRSKDQTQNATLKTPRLSSIHQTQMEAGKQKNAKATKHEVQLPSLVEKSRDPSLRRLKIMRALGLIPPAASPFMRTGAGV
ncbi:treacle protein-like isoform X6 [Coffea eugenioides]|uniref:treacle protein-like isoform X6 n=1 Tax=Coffea eugenioides TaxID=49369 RepID=UPI000F6092C8|nr:treacle protein-like isoform X6 [Coffea eugenioides]